MRAAMCRLGEAVVAAVPQQNRAAHRAQVDVPFLDPGDVVPAPAAGARAESLAHRVRERRRVSLVIQQLTITRAQHILERRQHPGTARLARQLGQRLKTQPRTLLLVL
jgi:hypothetical protein